MYGSLKLEGLHLDWDAELRDPRVWVRRGAAHHLARCPQLAYEAMAALGSALGDEDAGVRKWAARALDAAGPAARGCLQVVLGHHNPEARTYAAELLGRLGPAAREAVPGLRAALQDPEPRVRRAAAEALRSLGEA